MAVRSELFAATHAEAVARADALSTGREPGEAPSVDLGEVTAIDLEELGAIAAKAVQFGSGDLEVAEVDLDHEELFSLPPFLCDVLAEAGRAEDPDVPGEIAAAWAATEDAPGDADRLLAVLTSVVELVTRAQGASLGLYLWTGGH
jgi:hypothetical protein